MVSTRDSRATVAKRFRGCNFKKQLVVALLLATIVLGGCSNKSSSSTKTKESTTSKKPTDIRKSESTEELLKNVRFWAYQIQDQDENGNIQKLASTHYDLLVIDQTRSLKGQEDYNSKKDVDLLKKSANSKGKRKLVICYIDIGEAESYRWYWQTNWKIGDPDWIVAEDPDGWDENFPVKFWEDEWKEIMERNIDRIIEDGYDGVYLDWLEIYSFKQVADAAKQEGLDTRVELIKFIDEVSEYARSKKPDFIFIAQNAAEMGKYPEYVRLFDAIAQEAVWFDGSGDPDTGEHQGDRRIDKEDSRELINYLEEWQKLGKPVFNVEYAKDPDMVKEAYRQGGKNGFLTYVTLRPLDRITNTLSDGYKNITD